MLPAKWRPRDPGTVFTILPWPIAEPDRLMVLPPDRWRDLLTKLRNRPLNDRGAAALEKMIAESADQVTTDKVGRICLNEEHARLAKLKNEAELVGCLNKFEIWEPAACDTSRVETRRLALEALGQIEL
jgi:MraZ protein